MAPSEPVEPGSNGAWAEQLFYPTLCSDARDAPQTEGLEKV